MRFAVTVATWRMSSGAVDVHDLVLLLSIIEFVTRAI